MITMMVFWAPDLLTCLYSFTNLIHISLSLICNLFGIHSTRSQINSIKNYVSCSSWSALHHTNGIIYNIECINMQFFHSFGQNLCHGRWFFSIVSIHIVFHSFEGFSRMQHEGGINNKYAKLHLKTKQKRENFHSGKDFIVRTKTKKRTNSS